MDFQNFASKETSTLLAQLLTSQSGAAVKQLAAVREALDAAVQALANPAPADREIHELVSRLASAADTDVRRIREEASAAIERMQTELRAQLANAETQASALAGVEAERALLRSELQTAHERLEGAERDLSLTVDAHAELEAALRKLEAEFKHASHARAGIEGNLAQAHRTIEQLLADVEQLRGQLERETAESTSLQQELNNARGVHGERDAIARELDAARGRMQSLEAELATAHQTREERDRFGAQLEADNRRIHELEGALAAALEAGGDRDAIAARLDASGARVQMLEAAHAEHEAQIGQLTTRLDEALQSEARLQEKLASRASESAAGGETDVEIMRAEVDRMVSLLDASARAVTEMAAAASSADLLTELLKRLSLQFSRVALFRVKGNRLEGEQQVGFDDANTVTRLEFPLSVDSILSRAVSSRTIETVTGADVAARIGMPLGGAPTAAVAVPIVLQGTTIAVVYGDDADMPDWARGPAVHESSVGFARLLVGQVVVLLMRHTHEMKTLAELRQYATTLLQEAKEMYLADAQAGKAAELLRSRLKDNLECASQLYTYRAAMEGTAAAALLDEQIVAELEESTPFAEDLASVVAQMAAGDLQITAEAS